MNDIIGSIKHGFVFYIFGAMFVYLLMMTITEFTDLLSVGYSPLILPIPFFLMGFFEYMLD